MYAKSIEAKFRNTDDDRLAHLCSHIFFHNNTGFFPFVHSFPKHERNSHNYDFLDDEIHILLLFLRSIEFANEWREHSVHTRQTIPFIM